jgi:hypothetical protein
METAMTMPPVSGTSSSSFIGSADFQLFDFGSQKAERPEWWMARYRDALPDALAFEATAYVPLNFAFIIRERSDAERIFDAIQSLYLSPNRPRDYRIAERLTALYRDALAENETILPESARQFTEFFRDHRHVGLPKITLTPDGTLRIRWIQGPGSFSAIEFTGKPLVKLVAEVPRRGGEIERHFISEPAENVVAVAHALGVFIGLCTN